MSDFASIHTALSGLMAHRRALETIGHNVANAATEGYSRRRVDLVSSAGGVVPAVFSTPRAGGNGVDVAGTTRVRDALLEGRVRTEVAAQARLDAEVGVYDRIEMALPEPSDTGLAAQLADFWAGWHDVANQPQEPATRRSLLEQASTLTAALNRGAVQLENARADLLTRTEATVSDANALAARVAELNGAIRTAVAAGVQPDDLMDQRDVLVGNLVQLVGGTVRDGKHGMVNVFVGGSAYVRDDRSLTLQVVEESGPTTPDVGTPFSIAGVRWAGSEAGVALSGGAVSGLLAGMNAILPRYVNELNAVAGTLVSTVNALHSSGVALDGSTTGLTFFNPAATTARSIALSTDVAGQPERVAAGVPSGVPGGTLDGSVAQQIALLSSSTTGADARYRSLIGTLGVEAQAVVRRADMQASVVTQVNESAASVRGVSIDEELANLVASQQAYGASARVLTAVDEMLDTLITRTGVVGR